MCKIIILALSSFITIYSFYLVLTSYDCHINVIDSYRSICCNDGNPYSCIKLKTVIKLVLKNGTIDMRNINIDCDTHENGSLINCTDQYNNINTTCNYYSNYYDLDITFFSFLLSIYLIMFLFLYEFY